MGRHSHDLIGRAFSIQTRSLAGLFRVVYVSLVHNEIYLYAIHDALAPEKAPTLTTTAKTGEKPKRSSMPVRPPRRLPLSMFMNFSAQECADAKVDLPLRASTQHLHLSDDQKKRYDCIKKRLEAAVAPDSLERMLVLGQFGSVIADIARRHGVDRTTILRDVSRYFYVGSDLHKTTMLTILGRGGEKKERNVVKKLGRKRDCVKTGHAPEREGVNSEACAEDVKDLLDMTPDRKDMTDAELHRDYQRLFVNRVVGTLADGTLVRAPDPNRDITYGQFRWLKRKIESPQSSDRAKLGASVYAKDLRILFGHARQLVNYPGHTYIIDATVGDIYLVSAMDRKLLIGRPVIYVVIDAFSSLIVSIHVCLEGPNLEQAKIALYRAMTDKSRLLQNLGMSRLLSAFPQGCRPTFLFSDRGELLADGARSMAETIGLAQSLAAPYRADWKSLVERYFGVQNNEVLHWQPGAVRRRSSERGNRDVRLDAALTVNELLRLLLSAAAQWNLTKDMSQHVSGTFLRREIDATPHSFFTHGLPIFHGAPKYLDRSDAVRQLLSPADARATRMGVEANALRFTNLWMRDEDTFYSMKQAKEVSLFPDPDCATSAFLVDPTSSTLQEIHIVDERRYSEEDVAIEDILMMEDYMPLKRSDQVQADKIIVATELGYREDLVAAAIEKTKAAKSGDERSKTKQVADLKVNRAAEALGAMAALLPLPTSQTYDEDSDDGGEYEAMVSRSFDKN